MITKKDRLTHLKSELKLMADASGAITSDPETDHYRADTLLLDFIRDKEVTELYDKIKKWYA